TRQQHAIDEEFSNPELKFSWSNFVTFSVATSLLELNAKWGWELPFGWIPMTSDEEIPHTEIYQAEPFEEIAPEVIKLLKTSFNAHRIYEVEEGGKVEEKLLDDCVFGYDGLEHLYTNRQGEFMLYFSHEDSVTVGGADLLRYIHKIWPAYNHFFWYDGDTYEMLMQM
ncbi:MAG: hypothetical protein ACRYFX_13800, partial [Janthinobacterium lividum]